MPPVEDLKASIIAKINNVDSAKALQTLQFLLTAFITNAGTQSASVQETLYGILQGLDARGL